MYYCRSLIRKRQQFNKERSRKGVKAKARLKLESPMPQFPPEITENCYEIRVKRYLNGIITEKNYFLDGISNNTFCIWDLSSGHECRGVKGKSKAFILMGQDFPALRLITV